jgi:hypothetical protein
MDTPAGSNGSHAPKGTDASAPLRGDLPGAPPIPEELLKPVDHPAARPKPAPGGAIAGLGELGKAVSIGVDFLCTAAAGGLLGWLIDRWQGWSGAGLVVGAMVGFIVATVRLLRRLNADTPKRR